MRSNEYATGGMRESSLGGTLLLYSVDAFRYCAMSKDCATHFKGGEGRLQDVLGSKRELPFTKEREDPKDERRYSLHEKN